MNYGLYLSASGVLTNLYRQDVFANNLANVETIGFKRDIASIMQRSPESVEDGAGADLSHDLLDRLGGGVLAGPQRISFVPGPVHSTGRPLDAALQAPNEFFVVGEPDPETGEVTVRLTRDGRFARDSEGFLVTASSGHRVLDRNDQAIRIPDGAEVRIDQAGRLVQGEEVVGRVQVTGVQSTDALEKRGHNLIGFSGEDDQRSPAKVASIRAGFVEASGVEPIKTLTNLIAATKSVTSNGNLIRYHDLLMDRAVNTLGRVA